jgi:hypothetical protein
MATRTVHLVLYLPNRTAAVYRRTADRSHAALTVTKIPADVTDRAVEIAANLTSITSPSGRPCIVDYAQLGKDRFVNLFPR